MFTVCEAALLESRIKNNDLKMGTIWECFREIWEKVKELEKNVLKQAVIGSARIK